MEWGENLVESGREDELKISNHRELKEDFIDEESSKEGELEDEEDEITSQVPHYREGKLPLQEEREDLKPLPPNVKNAFLDKEHKFSVIVATDLSNQEEQQLLEVIRKYKKMIGWSLSDIVGISPQV
ncbi:hypothetical protein AHAS_Ahas20G0197300 [Arachis hypogaea]